MQSALQMFRQKFPLGIACLHFPRFRALPYWTFSKF